MATLDPVTWAHRAGTDTHNLDAVGSSRLHAWIPAHLKRRGFLETWPAPGEVFGVAGVPSDATVPGGTTVAMNTDTGTLYRKVKGVWKSVDGEV